jgi:hypothetical protein
MQHVGKDLALGQTLVQKKDNTMDKVWKFGNVATSPIINSCRSLGAAAKFLSCKKCIVHILQTQTTHLHLIFIPVVYI